MQDKYRFIGIRPFEEKEKDLFFERNNCAEKIFKSIYFNKITVVHSVAGTGKTSLIKAGLLPKVNSNEKFNTFYFSIPNYIKATNISPIKIIGEKIDEYIGEFSYLDKIISPEDSLWYKLKRLSGTDDKETLIILDQFENIFSFSETEIVKFKEEIVEALFEQIPQHIRVELNDKLKDNPKLLTAKGLEKLYKTINLKILFVSRSDKLFKLNFFKDKINAIDKNLIEVEQIDRQQARNILLKTANFKTKYNIDDDFVSEPFKFSDELIEEILNFLTKNNTHNIETYQLQIIGREIEILSVNKSLNIVDVLEVSDFKGLYNDYYEAVINEISNSIQRVAARKFIEGELIFEYEHRKLTILESVAKIKYNLSDKTIDELIKNNLILVIKNENGDVFFEISHDALITPILIAKEKRIKYEIRIEKELLQKKIIEEKAKAEEKRAIRNKKISYVFLSLFLLMLILGTVALRQRNIAVKNQKLANSSLFASIAFKYLHTDPTLSFRYAQRAFTLDKENPIAISSVLYSYYKSNIFYSKNINTAIKCDDAIFSDDCSKIVLVSNSEADNLSLTLLNADGEIVQIIPQTKIMSSVNFSSDGKYIIVSYYNDETKIFDLKGNIIQTFKSDEAFTLFADFSDDNSKIVTCNSNNIAKIWSFEGELQTILKGHSDEIKYADFSSNNNLIVTIGQDANVIVFDTIGNIVSKYTYLLEYEFQSNDFQPVKFFPDDQKVLFVVNDNLHFNYQIIVWDYKKNEIVSKYNKFDAFINNVSFIDNKTIIVSTKNNESVIIDLNENNYRKLLGHTDWVFDAKVNRKESRVYTISKDQTIKSWKIFNPNKKFEHLKNKQIIKLSNSGSYFSVYDGSLVVFSLVGDTLYHRTKIKTSDIVFSQDDESILTYYNRTITIHDYKTEKIKKIELSDSILKASFEGKELKIICKSSIVRVDENGIIINSQKLPFEINNAYFGDDYFVIIDKEKYCVIDSKNAIIAEKDIYDIKNVKIAEKNSDYAIFSIPKTLYFTNNRFESFIEIYNENKISTIEISKSGKLFSFGDIDGNCKIFDKHGEEVFKFVCSGQILNIQFSPNEKTVFVQYFDKYYNKLIKQFVIAPQEIIKYIDDLKLFGDVFMPENLKVDFREK